jgi:aminoglycoside 6-adenylyltransferase
VIEDLGQVAGAAVIGSRAVEDAGQIPDQAADLDLLVFTGGPQELLAANVWLGPLGRIWASTVDRTVPGLPVKRLLLDHSAQVDILILPVDAVTRGEPAARAVLAEAARRGFRSLKEGGPVSDGLRELAKEGTAAFRAPPSQEEFSQLVARFWIDSVRASKRLNRGEVWAAKRIIDGAMKDAVVRLEAWIRKAVKGPEWDTFWDRRHLEEWAGDRFLRDLVVTSGPGTSQGVRQDLFETMDQFRLLAIQAGARWSLDYAEAVDRKATVWVRT